MISLKLKSITRNRKIRKALRDRRYPENRDEGKVGLITDLADERLLSGLYRDLKIAKDDFLIVTCKSGQELPKQGDKLILDKKEVSLTGEFRSEQIQDFLTKEFDLLICFFSEEYEAGSLLAAQTVAGRKFGNKPDPFGIYDLEILAHDPGEFKEEVIKYFRIFKKKN